MPFLKPRIIKTFGKRYKENLDVGSRFHLFLSRTPTLLQLAGRSLTHLLGASKRRAVLPPHPVVLSGGERACVHLLPVPALEMASVMQNEYTTGLYTSFSRICHGHSLTGKVITTDRWILASQRILLPSFPFITAFIALNQVEIILVTAVLHK